MSILTDTHTHLYAEEFDTDRDLLIREAIHQGVGRFFMPNIESSTIEGMLELENKYPENCFPMMGLHPCSVKANWESEMRIVEDWLNRRKFVAVGEMGIDLYWDKTFVEEQKEVFKRQVDLANQFKIQIVIHSRDSFELIYELLLEKKKKHLLGSFIVSPEMKTRRIGQLILDFIWGLVVYSRLKIQDWTKWLRKSTSIILYLKRTRPILHLCLREGKEIYRNTSY